MRVIAGTSRGRRLTEFKGKNIRPTPDRVREALFSILQNKLGSFNGLKILDLFAGSGSLAIESLSRGAEFACLVEKDPLAAKTIRENLHRCRLLDRATLTIKDAFTALPEFKVPFDVIFLDPPFNKTLAEMAAKHVEELGLLSPEGILCAETGADEDMPAGIGAFIRIDQRRYGSVMIHFYSISLRDEV
jgi:16S rRNA (guanine(966)-N(2))-methyltransferase RsmD